MSKVQAVGIRRTLQALCRQLDHRAKRNMESASQYSIRDETDSRITGY